jgi:CRISPR-associated endoribonuclease Cas6
MRLLLRFRCEQPLELPINYQDWLIGFIYTNISDEVYRKFVHEEGYVYRSRAYRHFAFSRIDGKYWVDREKKTITFQSPFTLLVTSPIDKFLQEFARSMLLSDQLRIGKYPVVLESFEVLPEGPEMPDHIRIRMLSPLVVYSTMTHPNGMKYTYYYHPQHVLFSSMVEANLKRRYFSVHPENPELFASPISIRPVMVTPRNKVITRFRGLIIEGWMGEYVLSGDPRFLRWAYHTCLGSKGSQGFGVFEIIR